MNRSQRILPVYSGDVSGACSALFELGGMVVIHDPSGCNSTYNTHDETRWYDQNSLIFISALNERDAILGNDQKLMDDVADAVAELQPRFVALCNSPIPYLSGTDFAAIVKMLERRCGVPCFYVPTNGMHDYTMGAGRALACIADRFVWSGHVVPGTANVLGVTPLDFCMEGSARKACEFVEDCGFEVRSCWAMGSSLDELARAGEAQVNLVVSSVGLKAAQALRDRFGTPYVVGRPMGAFRGSLAQALREAVRTGECLWPCRDARTATDGSRCVVGEPVDASSFAASCELEGEEPVRVVCSTEAACDALLPCDVRADGEEAVEAAISQAEVVYADVLYAPVCPTSARLVARPHLAFSGRQAFAQ